MREFLRKEIILSKYPGLAQSPYSITSNRDERYNCIAWVVGEKSRWWDPNNYVNEHGMFSVWPKGCPRDNTLAAWVTAFTAVKFRECETPVFEQGMDKIAIYGDPDPSHVAVQLSDRNGTWSSKLGNEEDFTHDLAAFGPVRKFMKREGKWRADKSLLALATTANFKPAFRPDLAQKLGLSFQRA